MNNSSPFRRSPKPAYLLLAIVLSIGLGLLLAYLTDWPLFIIWILSVSVITFLAYGYDKAQAQSGGWRIPEVVLHGLALAGGFLGGWLGRAVFHHKTRKSAFTVVLALSTIIYLGLAIWILV
jgi:uncharacterized membrane protein YsdA (DUF1294 family)